MLPPGPAWASWQLLFGGLVLSNGPGEPRGRFCSAGPIFGRPKMGEKGASPLRAGPPLFFLTGLGLTCSPVATEHLPGLWPLITGTAVLSLRLTALVLKDVTVFSDRTREVFHRSRQFRGKETRLATPSKGRQPKHRPAARYRSAPWRILSFGGNAPAQSYQDRLDKRGGPGSPRRAFAYFSRVGKVGRRRQKDKGKQQRNSVAGASRQEPPGALGAHRPLPAGQGAMLRAMSAFPSGCGKPSR